MVPINVSSEYHENGKCGGLNVSDQTLGDRYGWKHDAALCLAREIFGLRDVAY